ncbi:MAG: UDP-N-acetylglucosamine--N-acetylmuramyl-(pentapeptide) pyrophosphoryl-undecaprenol N-acetylglucosamine transferase [Opitutaceae bacterium]|jgi:UDP-N-acetylglucosamine--N-acetylmuramyl-(pentapeptide) pyrophosphoryl-undecaprenol N-acetylglucosamine transferase|nr:UDP-N-acetylglucosamine--N-acetylmuramyl-(pentapeptide) pyrophosphoryl-undecaprenol N-acetylglucosamine transferase [Opitutaceae bacterium]
MTANNEIPETPPPPRHYLVACGGTGGHLAPGIALAQALARRGHAATLLISDKPVDARLAGKYPALGFRKISAAPLSFSPKKLARFLAAQTRGLREGLRLVREKRPAAIIGFGGFTSAAIVAAGLLRRVPVALHESNRVPGRATRLLARFARLVWLPPGVAAPGMDASKIRFAGLPLREEIRPLPADAARARLGLPPGGPVLSVLGGSQGAAPLNAWALAAAPALAAAGVRLRVITGLGKQPADAPAGVCVPFTDDIPALLSASDLVVARAGAGTIAELVRCETPSVLVPYPQAADDHQRANARHFAATGAALVVEQDALAGLLPVVLSLLRDHGKQLAAMREALRRQAADDPLPQILADIERLS